MNKTPFVNHSHLFPHSYGHLTEMFRLQGELQTKFAEIEKMPLFPIPVSAKASQVILKDFIYRTIEELSEAFIHVPEIVELASTNRAKEAVYPLEKFNEELADALHFLLDLLLYSGIGVGKLADYIASADSTENVLRDLFRKARADNAKDEMDMDPRKAFLIPYTQDDFDLLKGGRYCAPGYVNYHSQFLWHITWQLSQSGNLLKNKAWTVKETSTPLIEYQASVMDAFYLYIRYVSFCNLDETSLYLIYKAKNEINWTRIKNKR